MHVLKEVLGDEIPVSGNLHRPGPVAKFTDLQVIVLSLTSECLGIDSELFLFEKLNAEYKQDFPNLISRRQYNDRRKHLFSFQELIRLKLAKKLNQISNIFAVDSMPLEICKMARSERNKMGKEEAHTSPSKGYCASQNRWYYGYKIHALCAPDGVIEKFDLTNASIHDIHYLKDIGNEMQNCVITGDRGYISKPIKKALKEERNISMIVPYRNNQSEKKDEKIPYKFKVIRKRIETVFSQLCDQFMMQRNYAKSFTGYKTRILAKISGMTTLQFINRFINNKPVGQIKYALK